MNDEQAWLPLRDRRRLPYVMPGDYAKSVLWQRVKGIGNIMPPPSSGPPLLDSEVATIGDWIANLNHATLTVLAQPSDGGTVTGGGKFPIGSIQTIVATANQGWTFLHWDDGSTTAARTITVPPDDVTYTGFFQPVGSSLGSSLANASTRLSVQTGPNIGIAGFIITGQSQTVVIRGLGPTLSQFGVEGVLADPTLLLFNEAQQVIASNDDWQTTVIDGTIITGNQVNEILSSGFAPFFATESVLIATLPPGNYTAQLQGANNTTGVALVEVYTLP